jgi:hypothetical protein
LLAYYAVHNKPRFLLEFFMRFFPIVCALALFSGLSAQATSLPAGLNLSSACEAKILAEAVARCERDSKNSISRTRSCRLEGSQMDSEWQGQNFELLYTVGDYQLPKGMIDTTAIWDYLVTLTDAASCSYSIKITDF